MAAQTRQAAQQQNTEAYWQGHAEFIYDCIRKYFEKNFQVFFDARYGAYSAAEAKHLTEVLGEVLAGLRREWTAFVGKRTAELTTREQTNKLNDKVNALEHELATVKGELRSARDMAGQFRSLEQSLAARQLALLEAQRGPKGLKGEKGERGAQGAKGERGAPGKFTTPPEIATWRLDIPNYKASPLLDDGRMGAELDLKPFLQQFIDDALRRSVSNLVSDEVEDQLKRLQGRSF